MSLFKQKWAPMFFLSPYLIMYMVFGLFPILFSFYLSLTSWDGIKEKTFVGLDNYKFLFSADSYFFLSIWNALLILLMSLPLQMGIGLFIAILLFSRYVKCKALFQLANFLPYIVTPVAVGLIFSLLFDWQTGFINRVLLNLGWVNEAVNWLGDPFYARLIIAFMLIWKGFGYTMVFYLAGLSNIQKDLYEAASMDGARPMRIFFHITLPLLKPVTSFILITGIIHGFQLLEEPMLIFKGLGIGSGFLIGGPDRCCLTPVWNLYDTAFGSTTRYGLGAAIAYGLCILIAFVSFMGLRFLDKGESGNE